MTKLAIFDLDGTLLDTLADLAQACNHALKACGYPQRNPGEYNLLVGKGIYNLFKGALPEDRRTPDDISNMADIFIPYYEAHKCDLTRPYDGIPEMLDALTGAGVRIAVASNKYQAGAEGIVSTFFGKHDFVKILGQRDGMPIKPDPEIVEEIMAAAQISDKAEVIYAGDSDVDMQTGINAGIRTVGVTWGFRSEEELAAFDPWKMADSPEELLDIILAC